MKPARAAACRSWPPNWPRSCRCRLERLAQTVGYAICLLFWFVPPLWLAYTALLREAETCCDQQVINRGFRGPEYARQLVELIRHCHGRVLLPRSSRAIGRKALLKQRISRVLGLEPRRPALPASALARVAAIWLCCLAPLLAVTCATKPPLV